jgi:hypothetical protein
MAATTGSTAYASAPSITRDSVEACFQSPVSLLKPDEEEGLRERAAATGTLAGRGFFFLAGETR